MYVTYLKIYYYVTNFERRGTRKREKIRELIREKNEKSFLKA